MATASDGFTAAPARSEFRPPFEGLVVADTYRVFGLLGSGGMGDVYQAEHVRLGSPVAVKFLRANALGDPRSVERFRHEARRVAHVRSENIVKVFDYGELPDGTPYFVMERLFGEDLRALLERERPLPVRRAVKLVVDACRGLAVVHAAGLVHRDLKPANLFVEALANGTEVCKVLDFGVVKALASDTTRQGAVLGTVRYMAPEQLENAASARASADVYALGAILYECLTGESVQSGETLQEVMFAILHKDPKPPSELRSLPAALEDAMLRALSRDMTKRFANAEELARALAPFGAVDHSPRLLEAIDEDTLSDAGAPAASEPPPARAPQRGTRKLALLVLGALGVGAGTGWFARGSAPAASGAAGVVTRAEATSSPAPDARSVAPAPPVEVPRSAADSQAQARAGEVPLAPGPPAVRPAAGALATSTKMPPRKRDDRVRPAPSAAAPLASAKAGAASVGRFDSNDPYE